MNKDVIYIEPENDITDIIDRVKTSKSALVALVPPKKSTVLGSAVNFKLLARASRAAGKSLVLVSADAALLKLAALAEIPAAKNLQTRPEIPLLIKDNTIPIKVSAPNDDNDNDDDSSAAGDTADTPKKDAKAPKSAKEASAGPNSATPVKIKSDPTIIEIKGDPSDEESADENSAENPDKSTKKDEKSSKKPRVPSLDRLRKWIILGSIGVILIVGFLVWALVFAPSVKIIVSLRTTGSNFSSAVSFVTAADKEIIEEGVFALETAELTKKVSADFAATGEANKGTKASGTISVYYAFFSSLDPIAVPAGTTFTNKDLSYTSTAATTLTYDPNACVNSDFPATTLTCRIAAKIPVTATDPGEKYNTEATSGWTQSGSSTLSVTAAAIAGGTDKIVKIVSQRDFDNAKNLLSSSSESSGRTELLEKFPDSTFPIDGSLKIETKPATSSPKVGEEVAEGVTPSVSSETVFFMYGVDRGKISRFIESQLAPTVAAGQKIYSTGVSSDPELNKARIENYKVDGDNITAKLTSYGVQTGPSISEPEILEKSKGRKIGEARTLLKPLLGSNGDIVIEPSVFWVSSIPEDPNKVEIIVEIEE